MIWRLSLLYLLIFIFNLSTECGGGGGWSVSEYRVKRVLRGHSKRSPTLGFQDRLSLNAGETYCRMLQESILRYFRPLLGYHLSLRPFRCQILRRMRLPLCCGCFVFSQFCCDVLRLVSFLVLQSYYREWEIWLLYFYCNLTTTDC